MIIRFQDGECASRTLRSTLPPLRRPRLAFAPPPFDDGGVARQDVECERQEEVLLLRERTG